MTAREAINAMFRYLRTEQRTIPFAGDTYDDPLPDALDAMNATLQQMAVFSPLFAAKQQRSAYFRAPSTLAVSGLTNGGLTATGTWASWMVGCQIVLPGSTDMNRIMSYTNTTATLQFPHLSDTASGTATINVDCAELPADVITVLEPVRYRGSRTKILPAGGRDELATGDSNDIRYFIESAFANNAVSLRMMLSGYVTEATVFEFQARVALGTITQADIYDEDTPAEDPGRVLPVPANFVESIFMPLALDAFFSKPCIVNHDVSPLRNEDAPKLIREQAKTALAMLERMRPQGRKPARLVPGWD